MLNDVDALADGEKGRGTYVEIKKKRAMDALERELFSNKKQVVQYVSDKPISTDACANISNTNSINATSLELGKGKVILMGDNSGKGKNPVNHDKDIDVGSKKKVQNTFPDHVKSLLSSGLLDGVPVKYISMLSEKSLIGVIEGNDYLCSCDNCKLSEATFSFTLLLFVLSFENKSPEMLKDVDALADGGKGRGTYVEIEKKCAIDASEREIFTNKKQVVQYVSDKPISTDTCVNISNTNSINATSLEHGKGKVISMGDNSEKGKNPMNHDKDIGVDSKKKVQNTFPTNIKSLLSSGLLDGVPVKYISMSSEASFDS
ncbi:hypothetical protein RDI58_010064 [Solanum bulbocastanum]|uniref:Uncharacterized protein n=1 Tax=Solanum bulbocastanum TaxID=147425 RepID=A0AAN8TM53_SOLBU